MPETGRPSKYSDEMINKVDEYLEQCVDKIDEFHKTRGDKSDSYIPTIEVNLPTIEGFSLFLGVCKKTIMNWEKDYPDFLHATNKIRTLQHERLISGALSGNYNPLIAKLMLSTNHGYSEKKKLEHSGGISGLLKEIREREEPIVKDE